MKQNKSPRELAARALCRINGVPEDTKFKGAPMWRNYLTEADVVLEAVGWPGLAEIRTADMLRDEERRQRQGQR